MSIFREYDIRGIYKKDLYHEIVFKIGFLLGDIIKLEGMEFKISIGYDARVHSIELFKSLSNGFRANGINVFNLGVVPTPVTYFASFNTSSLNSVMITGSHNPPEYNGFKITINRQPFYGKQIKELENKLLNSNINLNSKLYGEIIDYQFLLNDYVNFLSEEFIDLKDFPFKIGFDCGNGVAGVALENIIKNLNLNTNNLHFVPDGTFPNHHPDPSEDENLQDLKKVMNYENIDIGIAFDGDGDRVRLISKNYNFKGDELAILFARDIAKTLENPIVIGEVKCSSLMYDEINKIGKAIMYKTGHSNLKIKIKELNAALACEMSGHIFFNDRYFGYDDAIYASLRILELIKKWNGINSLEDSIRALPKIFNTNEEKIDTTDENKFKIIDKLKYVLEEIEDFPKIKKIIDIDGIRIVFENGWGLIRASNTTPVLVTRFEANSIENLNIYKNAILNLIDKIKL